MACNVRCSGGVLAQRPPNSRRGFGWDSAAAGRETVPGCDPFGKRGKFSHGFVLQPLPRNADDHLLDRSSAVRDRCPNQPLDLGRHADLAGLAGGWRQGSLVAAQPPGMMLQKKASGNPFSACFFSYLVNRRLHLDFVFIVCFLVSFETV